NDMAGETLVQPANVTKIPRLEVRIRKSPRRHLLNGPLSRGFMIRRASQPRTINVSEHVLGVHELRIVRFFFANAFEQIVVALTLNENRQVEQSCDQADSERAAVQHLVFSGKRFGFRKAAGLYLV